MSVEEGKPLYRRLEGGTPIRLRNSTAKLAIIPNYGSLKQLIYTSLAKVLDDGSFAKIGKCIEPSCRKFFWRNGRDESTSAVTIVDGITITILKSTETLIENHKKLGEKY